MKKNRNGLAPLEEYNRFRTRLFDAVDEWITYYGAAPDKGLAIEPSTLEVEVCGRDEARTREWCPLAPLASGGQADADAVFDLADRLCFVR